MHILQAVKDLFVRNENYFSLDEKDHINNLMVINQAVNDSPANEQSITDIELQALMNVLNMHHLVLPVITESSFVTPNGFVLAIRRYKPATAIVQSVRKFLYPMNLHVELKNRSYAWDKQILVFRTDPICIPTELAGYVFEHRLRDEGDHVAIEHSFLVQNLRTGTIDVHWKDQPTCRTFEQPGV